MINFHVNTTRRTTYTIQIMKSKLLLLISFALVFSTARTQDTTLYEKALFIQDNDTMPYRILLPIDYDIAKTYPLVYVLHGAGERGNDNKAQLVHGSGLFLRDSIRTNFPAIVVFPQCPANSFWANIDVKTDSSGNRIFGFREDGKPTVAMDMAQQLLKRIMNDYPVNKNQVYVGGLSMGGMGTFEIVRRNPKLFAAAFPICGGAAPATAKKLTNTSWWVFHGDADPVVPLAYSTVMVNALTAENADVKFSVYPGVGHDSWNNAFAEPTLLPWLFSHVKQ